MHVFLFLIAVDCDSLADPVNGQVTHTAGTTLGQTATYSCNAGYNLVGNSTRTCQVTGVWSGSEPTCQGMLTYVVIKYMMLSLQESYTLNTQDANSSETRLARQLHFS